MYSSAGRITFLLAVIDSCINGFRFNHIIDRKVRYPTGRRRSTSMSELTIATEGTTPKLIVFDLDNTIWTPELYTLRKIERNNQIPVAGRDVKLFPGAQAVLDMKKRGEVLSQDIRLAIASRTKSVEWAHNLLSQFGIRELFDYVEIFPGNKVSHFTNIHKSSGIAYRDMIFFDDARDGKYGNCVPVAELGVLSVHCPNGLETADIFHKALHRYSEWDGTKGTIVEVDGTLTGCTTRPVNNDARQNGVVKSVNTQKRFGFIRLHNTHPRDVFFHFSYLPTGATVEAGDSVSFTIRTDPKSGKPAAMDIELLTKDLSTSTVASITTMNCFSMNMPFAALLANGFKTLETRNGTMLVKYPAGTKMLLHVGQRTYPDGNRHIEIMKSAGLSDTEIDALKTMPPGFGRGMIVAICELGETYETTLQERNCADIQHKVAAYGEDSGKMVTEIKRVQYLKRPVSMSGKGGVFDVQFDLSLLPDGWSVSNM